MTYDPDQPMRRPRWTPGLYTFEGEWYVAGRDRALEPLGGQYLLGPYDAFASDWEPVGATA